jgi:hypothetical protein
MIIFYYRSVSIIFLLIFSLLVISGCKNESTIESQGNLPRIVSFTADPANVPVSGDSVKLSWIVNNASSLSISPGVGVVTPADSGTITIFVNTSTLFKLTATNSDGDVTANAQVTVVQPITVSGFVNDIDDVPMSGITVILKGKNPITTGANGDFSISNVLPPYEIRIIVGTVQTAVVYQGLTRSNPILYYPESTTQSKLAVIGGNVPPTSGKYTQVFFVTSTEAWSTIADQTTGVYSINATWRGTANSFNGKLHVLRWIPDSTGLPLQYDAYGFKNNLTINNGSILGNYNFTESDFSDPNEQNISGSIIPPTSRYLISSKYLKINFDNATVELAYETGVSLSDNFNYIVPVITGATFEVDALAQMASVPNSRATFYRKRNINSGTSGVIINLEGAPQLNVPMYNATGIDTTTQFNWTKESIGGVYLVNITPVFSGPSYYIFTSGNTVNIPNLSAEGLGLPANTGYEWFVNQLFPFSSMDDAAYTNFIPVFDGSVESGYATSETFQFTSHQ